MENHAELKRDLRFGIGTIVFSLLFCVSIVVTIKEQSMTGINGRAFPWLIAAFLFLLGLGLSIASWKRLRMCDTPSVSRPSAGRPIQVRAMIVYLGLVSAYVLGIAHIGFVVSTALFIVVLLVFYRIKSKAVLVLMVCVWPFLLWYVFHALIGVQFPEALLI